jgi:hypothetical protein
MKQTAVEWLLEQLTSIGVLEIPQGSNAVTSIIQQAKEMEKQQIIDCGNTCALMQHIHEYKVSKMSIDEVFILAEEDNITFGEQYYDETFKSEQDNEQICM